MSCGRGWAEDCRPPPLCGAVLSPPEHKTTRVNPSIRINSVQRVNSARTETRHHSSSAAMNEAGDWARVPGTAAIQIRLLLVEHIVIVLLSTILGTVLLLSLTPKPICGWVGSHEAKQELDGKSMTSKLFSVTMLCLQCPGLFSALCRTGTRSDLFRRDSKSVTTNAVSGGEGVGTRAGNKPSRIHG